MTTAGSKWTCPFSASLLSNRIGATIRLVGPWQSDWQHCRSLKLSHSRSRRFRATTREEVISELAKALGEGGFVEDTATVTELALRREAIVSTAVEHGLAFPHVRDVEGGGLTFAVGLKEKGIDFGATGDHLSKIFFFIVIPTPATAFYLRLLAGLVRTFESTEARKALLDSDKPDEMWKTLTKLTKDTVP